MAKATLKIRPANESKLNLDTIRDLSDGQDEAVVNAALKAAIRDVEDRGADKKPRKVTIEIELKKLSKDGVAATVKAKTSLPPYVTEPTYGSLKVDGNAVDMSFNPHNAANDEQQTIPMPGDEDAGE